MSSPCHSPAEVFGFQPVFRISRGNLHVRKTYFAGPPGWAS